MSNDMQPPRAQRWALWAALAAYIIFLFVYLLSRDIPYVHIREDGAAWGQFGDYVGGVINPVVGLITIWLLTASLKQSQTEMALTRKALEDAEQSQKATEAALRDQIAVSEHARDINNTIALWQQADSIMKSIMTKLESPGMQLKAGTEYRAELLKYLQTSEATRDKLGMIMVQETDRLTKIYLKDTP